MNQKNASLRHPPRRFLLWVCLGAGFTLLIGLVWTGLSFSSYYLQKKTALAATEQLAGRISNSTELALNALYSPAYTLASSLIEEEITHDTSLKERLQVFPSLASRLRSNPLLSSIFIAYEDGDFFIVRALYREHDNRALNAPPQTAFIVQSIEHTSRGKVGKLLFYNKELTQINERRIDDDPFDPRTRSWYSEAMQKESVFSTPPYRFFATKDLGVSIVRRSVDKKSVIGIDLRLHSVAKLLEQQLPTPHSVMALVNMPENSLIAYVRGGDKDAMKRSRSIPTLNREQTPYLFKTLEKYQQGQRGLLSNVEIGGRQWFLYIKELQNPDQDVDTVLLMAIPTDEIMKGAKDLLRTALEVAFAILLLSIPLIWLASQLISRPLKQLSNQAQQILNFNFAKGEIKTSRIAEVDVLARTVSSLKGTVRRFLKINRAIIGEYNLARLLKVILSEFLDVARANGGLIVVLDNEGQFRPEVEFCWKKGEGMDQFFTLPSPPLAILPKLAAITKGQTIHMTIARDDPWAEMPFLAVAFSAPEVLSLDLIHLPLLNNSGACLGLLTLIKAVERSEMSFQEEHIAFVEALSVSAAIALENNRLLQVQRDLLDALVKIIAGAIDAKSPYTGGHCQRVPVIFKMILEAACAAKEGPFKDFALNEDEWEEAELAAWLHDCGKVTTPEYVVDKATKLETIYDRIHEVRTRFEVLKRDAEIACLNDIIDGALPEARKQQLAAAHAELDSEFAFVAQCNLGSEFLDPDATARLEKIAQRHYLRTLEKRLGVARDEKKRMGEEAEVLPVRESLLADTPEHLIQRTAIDQQALSEELYDFKVDVPELLYNRGELYNLSVKRGTLSIEERFKINDHMVQTLIMLKNLPLPKHLKNVPNLAGNHHETLDGKGYPRKLSGNELDTKSRMMAIADIFEALTAADRPYKPGKTLSEALKIMEGFKERHHIDPEIYEFFIQSGIPSKYAAHHLRPEQCDV